MTQTDSARFDGDRWDLASSVGATATMVAAGRALAASEPDPLIADPSPSTTTEPERAG